jgi:hypothetical protein
LDGDGSASILDGSLIGDVDELESLVETLCFHVDENDFKSGEGWQRPLSELNETLSTYRNQLQKLRYPITGQDVSVELSAFQSQDARSFIRDMRLKFSISIALVT